MLLSIFGRPKVEEVRPRVSGIDLDGVALTFDMDVRNPYWFALRAPLVRYGLDVQGREFLKSEAPLKVALPARATATLSVPVRISYASLWGVYRDLRGSDQAEADYTLRAVLPVTVFWKRLEVPVAYEGRFPILKAPRFSDVRFRVSEASLLRAVVTIEAAVTNPNVFEVDIRGLGYIFKAGDVQLAGLTASTAGAIGPRQTGQVTLVGEVAVGRTALQLLRSGRLEKPSLSPTGVIKTPYGTVKLDRPKEE